MGDQAPTRKSHQSPPTSTEEPGKPKESLKSRLYKVESNSSNAAQEDKETNPVTENSTPEEKEKSEKSQAVKAESPPDEETEPTSSPTDKRPTRKSQSVSKFVEGEKEKTELGEEPSTSLPSVVEASATGSGIVRGKDEDSQKSRSVAKKEKRSPASPSSVLALPSKTTSTAYMVRRSLHSKKAAQLAAAASQAEIKMSIEKISEGSDKGDSKSPSRKTTRGGTDDESLESAFLEEEEMEDINEEQEDVKSEPPPNPLDTPMEPDFPSAVADLRGYHSEPNFPGEDDEKKTKKKKKKRLLRKGGNETDLEDDDLADLEDRCLSMEDLITMALEYALDEYDEHPDCLTGLAPATTDAEGKPETKYSFEEAAIQAYRDVCELEKTRLSFFDGLFIQGGVVDSMEVPSPDHEEGHEDYFIEANELDYANKISYGRVVMKTKHVYTGGFQDWFFHGKGKYRWVDGSFFEGEFNKGQMSGFGKLKWPDGSEYEGDLRNGTRTGWGVHTTAAGLRYVGDWLNGVPHGKGKMWYDPENYEGEFYDGFWANGKRHGQGTRQYGNGDRYIGGWVEGDRSGKGTMVWLNERKVYMGEWAEGGVPNVGKGRHIWYSECKPPSTPSKTTTNRVKSTTVIKEKVKSTTVIKEKRKEKKLNKSKPKKS